MFIMKFMYLSFYLSFLKGIDEIDEFWYLSGLCLVAELKVFLYLCTKSYIEKFLFRIL